MPDSLKSIDEARTLSAARPLSGMVPPSSQMPWVRASAARNAWMGPCPSASATAKRAAASRGINAKFSGSTTSRAPLRAASAINRRAEARLSSTLALDTICTAATRIFISVFSATSTRVSLLGSRHPDPRAEAQSKAPGTGSRPKELPLHSRGSPRTLHRVLQPGAGRYLFLEDLLQNEKAGRAQRAAGQKTHSGQAVGQVRGDADAQVEVAGCDADAPANIDIGRRPLGDQ